MAQKKDKPLAMVHKRTGKPLRITTDLPESLKQALSGYYIELGLGNSKQWTKVIDVPYDDEIEGGETEQEVPKVPRKKSTPIDRFIAYRKLRMTISSAAENPFLLAEDRDFLTPPRHWECVLEGGRQEMHTYISTTDLPGEPSLGQVLRCLAEQAREFDPEESLEDWAYRINLEPKDQKTIDAHAYLVDQVTRLKAFFGTRGYNRLLYDLRETIRPD